MRKRAFDLTICLLASPVWVPLMVLCALSIWCFEGRPIFYVSRRRVFGKKSIDLLKFRTMIRDADQIANRDTVPLDGVRFLNLPRDSPLYSRIGRIIERFHLTELPQVLHIISGEMSFIGNRPLPENVIACLLIDFPGAEERFAVRSGLTGPVQLIGRTKLSDDERLTLEVAYCDLCSNSYSVALDFTILLRTVLGVLGIQRFLLLEEAYTLMRNNMKAPARPILRRPSKPSPIDRLRIENDS